MEIEAEIPFYEELKDLFDNKKSKKNSYIVVSLYKEVEP